MKPLLSCVFLLIFLLTGCGNGGETAAPSPPLREATPPLAAPIIWDVSGTFVHGGTILGTLTYDAASTPTATNARGLVPNQIHTPTDWMLQVADASLLVEAGLQPILILSNLDAEGTADICLGHCILESPLVGRLVVATGTNSLQLLSQWPEGHELVLPRTGEDWGQNLSDASFFFYQPVLVAGPHLLAVQNWVIALHDTRNDSTRVVE